MADKEVKIKRPRGRPPKIQLETVEGILDEMEKAVKTCNAEAARNYYKYFKRLEDIALGKNKDAKVNNEIACLQLLLKRADDFMKEERVAADASGKPKTPEEVEEEEDNEDEEVLDFSNLVSHDFSKSG